MKEQKPVNIDGFILYPVVLHRKVFLIFLFKSRNNLNSFLERVNGKVSKKEILENKTIEGIFFNKGEANIIGLFCYNKKVTAKTILHECYHFIRFISKSKQILLLGKKLKDKEEAEAYSLDMAFTETCKVLKKHGIKIVV